MLKTFKIWREENEFRKKRWIKHHLLKLIGGYNHDTDPSTIKLKGLTKLADAVEKLNIKAISPEKDREVKNFVKSAEDSSGEGGNNDGATLAQLLDLIGKDVPDPPALSGEPAKLPNQQSGQQAPDQAPMDDPGQDMQEPQPPDMQPPMGQDMPGQLPARPPRKKLQSFSDFQGQQ